VRSRRAGRGAGGEALGLEAGGWRIEPTDLSLKVRPEVGLCWLEACVAFVVDSAPSLPADNWPANYPPRRARVSLPHPWRSLRRKWPAT
jgi:hypothetical protein